MSVVFVLAWLAAAPGADGCVSCHAETATVAVHAALLPRHAKVSCLGCHRGNGEAREKVAAHGFGVDELLFAERTGAACVACHVAGSVPGTEAIARGGRSYLERGCGFCHAGALGLGYVGAFAPPLFAVGSRGSEYLRSVLRAPKKTFPATVMPAYALPAAEERDLLAYLLSLRGDYIPPAQPAASKQRCATCHAEPKPKQAAAHRCAFILEERANLTCKRCHAGAVPKSQKECLYIYERRKECGRCHSGVIDGR
jgi:hypothetical protein